MNRHSPGGVIPDRIKTFKVLYLTDQTCLLTQSKVHYGQLYQTEQTGPEEKVLLAYLDQLTS